MNESLVSQSFDRFKKNKVSYISVGILCALFLVLAATLSFIDELVFILAIPLIALPFLFASHISCYLLEVGEPITLKAFFHYYFSFFRMQFRGSFRGITSFLKSLAVYGSVMLISYFVLYFVFQAQYGETFLNAAASVVNKYLDGASYEDLINMLNENDGMMLTFISYVSAIPLPFAITGFIYWISFNSISLYYRANINNGAPSLIRLAIANSYARYRRSMRKDWFRLNWLMLVLPLVGSSIAALIYFLLIKNALYLGPILTIGAFIPLLFFLPFYFPNMEVLYHRYENVFKEGNKMAVETILNRIQASIDLSEEEKRNLEGSFRNDNDKEE